MAATPRKHRYGMHLAGIFAGIALILGFVWFVHTMIGAKTNKKERQVQVVQIIRPPPPPPPPPPDQPPPPPPEKPQEQLPKDVPQPEPKDEPAPSQPLGLDAEGAAGGDAFGLAARHGGSDLVGGNGTAVFAWYTNRIKDGIVDCLGANSKLGSKKYSASVRVWIERDGKIRRQLASSTGSHELDDQLEAALGSCARTGDAPPLEMPQPVTLKIVSRI